MAIKSEMLEISELEKNILLLVYVDDIPIQDRKKLQILIYMLGDAYKEIRESGNFVIKDDGPYSEILENDLEHLIQIELVNERDGIIGLTKRGQDIAKNIEKEKGAIKDEETIFDIRIPRVFRNYKEIATDVTTPELLSYMYCEYPHMTKGSLTYEKLKPNIEEHIFSLLEKEKFSAGVAAELINKSIYYVRDKMRDMGILWLTH